MTSIYSSIKQSTLVSCGKVKVNSNMFSWYAAAVGSDSRQSFTQSCTRRSAGQYLLRIFHLASLPPRNPLTAFKMSLRRPQNSSKSFKSTLLASIVVVVVDVVAVVGSRPYDNVNVFSSALKAFCCDAKGEFFGIEIQT